MEQESSSKEEFQKFLIKAIPSRQTPEGIFKGLTCRFGSLSFPHRGYLGKSSHPSLFKEIAMEARDYWPPVENTIARMLRNEKINDRSFAVYCSQREGDRTFVVLPSGRKNKIPRLSRGEEIEIHLTKGDPKKAAAALMIALGAADEIENLSTATLDVWLKGENTAFSLGEMKNRVRLDRVKEDGVYEVRSEKQNSKKPGKEHDSSKGRYAPDAVASSSRGNESPADSSHRGRREGR